MRKMTILMAALTLLLAGLFSGCETIDGPAYVAPYPVDPYPHHVGGPYGPVYHAEGWQPHPGHVGPAVPQPHVRPHEVRQQPHVPGQIDGHHGQVRRDDFRRQPQGPVTGGAHRFQGRHDGVRTQPQGRIGGGIQGGPGGISGGKSGGGAAGGAGAGKTPMPKKPDMPK